MMADAPQVPLGHKGFSRLPGRLGHRGIREEEAGLHRVDHVQMIVVCVRCKILVE